MNYLESAIELIKLIEGYGYEAYIVGGAVRDYILRIDLYDIDITTNMPIDFSLEHFECTETGSAYQSIVIRHMGYNFEVTNYRKDISYIDHRHPVVERALSLDEDLVRRDFTINALALDKDMKIIDKFNGLMDIKNKVVKAIGNPDQRFNEDALRILRALYFSAKLDFTIEEETLNSIIRNKNLLAFLSKERIYEYFIRILYAKTNRGIDYINKYDLFSEIVEFKNWLSIVNNKYIEYDLCIPYYVKYNEFPIYSDKKRCIAAKNLIDADFSIYSIYENKEYVLDLLDYFKKNNYDVKSIKDKYDNLAIKDDKDLAFSKEEISKMFLKDEIGKAITKVKKAILEGIIKNDRDSIIKYLKD